MSHLNEENVKKLTQLCRIECTPGEQEALLKDLEKILCYEIQSSTNWSGRLDKPFDATEHRIISEKNLKAKLDAYACYEKELRPGFHPRSLDSLVTLAKFRGNSVGHEFAEAFMVIRHICND